MFARFRRRVTRSVPLSILAILVGAVMLTPAVSGAAAFLTKAKAKKLFLENTRVVTTTAAVGPSSGTAVTLNCPAGMQAVGGGVDSPAPPLQSGSTSLLLLNESRPIPSGARSIGWYLEITELGDAQTATAYAVCSK
ncbi:MAG TPA: hypothetical protein VE962_02685 [Actinomycetota bacterium]|nr:hypothetical protein [Actinomycetota bacterium]